MRSRVHSEWLSGCIRPVRLIESRKTAFFGEPRYLLICLPFLILLVALGINSIRRPSVILCIVMLGDG